ncbi:MAG: EAL domain-containing protein [Pseudomonadota bacterium]
MSSKSRTAWRSRISNTVVAWVAIFLFAIEAVVLIPSLQHREEQLVAETLESAKPQIVQFIRSLAKLSEVQAVIPPLMQEISIFDALGNPIISTDPRVRFDDLQQLQDRHGEKLDDSILFVHPVTIGPRVYSVVARLDTKHIDSALFEYVGRIAGLVLVILFVLMIGTWYVVQKNVVIPLRKVISAIQNLKDSQSLEWKRDDEFGELVDSYNEMIDNARASERREQIKQNHLEYIAYHDSVTNMMNRRAFIDRLEDESAHYHAAVFIVGIDGFKSINDQFGSEIGDAVVAENGRRLALFDSERRFSARLEGDEFGIARLSENAIEPEEEMQFTEKVLQAIREKHSIEHNQITITASIGFASASPGGSNFEGAYKNAAIALQLAKKGGGDRALIYDNAMRERITRRKTLISAMEYGLEHEEFFPLYQPKVCLKTNQSVGAECLIRWRRKDGSIVSPVEFIPLAEESGLIVDIGEQLLRQSLKDFEQLNASGQSDLVVAVNLSAVQLDDQSLPLKVEAALRDTGMLAQQLELEITESSIMENTDKSLASMDALRALGVTLAIDDFGTGYSSLSYLKEFPVQTLKIDQSFVADLCTDHYDKAIVSTIVELSHSFELKVVAEGIEHLAQKDMLNKMGCDVGQGYFIGKPMVFEEYVSWLGDWRQQSA